jgi:KDO2-lipid IV(A) lauroyltransferase
MARNVQQAGRRRAVDPGVPTGPATPGREDVDPVKAMLQPISPALPAGDHACAPALSRRRRWRRRAYHLLALTVLQAARLMPPPLTLLLCRVLGRIAWRVRPAERRRALTNLRLAFPGLSATEGERWLRQSAVALARNLDEWLLLQRDSASRLANVRGRQTLAAIRSLQAEGRGVLVLTGHLGCWELLGAYLAHHLGALAVVTGTIHNPAVDRMVQSRRRRLGMIPLAREEGPAPLLRWLRAGEVAAVLLDQHTRVQNWPVEFFGRPAPTPVGFAKLALRYQVPVLPVAIARRGRSHEVHHLPPLLPTGPCDEAGVGRFLVRCNAALEELVRRNPLEWIWFHNRWDMGSADAMCGTGRGTGDQA